MSRPAAHLHLDPRRRAAARPEEPPAHRPRTPRPRRRPPRRPPSGGPGRPRPRTRARPPPDATAPAAPPAGAPRPGTSTPCPRSGSTRSSGAAEIRPTRRTSLTASRRGRGPLCPSCRHAHHLRDQPRRGHRQRRRRDAGPVDAGRHGALCTRNWASGMAPTTGPEMQTGPPPKGWPYRKVVRRRPTLPQPSGCSTIGAERLNFRVRDGTGCFPFAMAAVTLAETHAPTRLCVWGCFQA